MIPLKTNTQTGSALLFAFVLLIALTFIAIASVNTGIMEAKMATNVEEEINSFQTAASMIDYILSDTETHLPGTGSATVTAFDCSDGDDPCDTEPATATFPEEVFKTIQDESLTVVIDYTNCGLPPRLEAGVDMQNFSSFSYRISANLNRIATGRGKSGQRQGYMELGPKC